MRRKYGTWAILQVVLFFICFTSLLGGNLRADEGSKYLKAVREFADNVLKYGRDTYGPKHTPLFVDGLNVHTHEPVKWIAPNGDRWILSNLASQQNLFRTLDGLTKITGDPKYKQAAMDAIEYAFDHLRSPNGLLYWGGHHAYDAGADKHEPSGRPTHELKNHYPYYELMWEVDSEATKQFIESFWSAHIIDWSNLYMSRHGHISGLRPKAWTHEYKGGDVFLGGEQVSFMATGSDLFYAAASLTKFTGNKEPLLWGKRLAHRYVETRDSNTGIAARVYTGERTKVPTVEEIKSHGLKVMGYDIYFPYRPTFGNPDIRRFSDGYVTVSPGIPYNPAISPWICALLVGEMMSSDGNEFIQWSVEELTAWGKVAYRKSDNSWIPMLRDGTCLLEGMIVSEDGGLGPKGTILKPVPAVPMDFWAYALAYRLTESDLMWRMARSIALGIGVGDIGSISGNSARQKRRIQCADPYALMGFLQLYKKTGRKTFLASANLIGDNILATRFYRGFFVPDGKHIYTRFDSPESIALLHLYAANALSDAQVSTMWPTRAFFEHRYRAKEQDTDIRLIYRLTELPEVPVSIQEAAAIGDADLIISILEKGVEVDWREDGWLKTALHRAAISGHADVVELLLVKGADTNARDSFGSIALHYAAEKGHKQIAELLIDRGADVNARRSWPAGDTPLHEAARAEHEDIVRLLIDNGADVNVKNNKGLTPADVAVGRSRRMVTPLTPVAKLLIAKGADISVVSAVHMEDLDEARELIQKGAAVNVKDQRGRTALHYAAGQGHKDIVEILLANGADVNSGDNYSTTPAEFAMRAGHNEVAKLLVSRGADISPLNFAIFAGDTAKAKSLIKAGADVNKPTPYGTTPLHRAVVAGLKDMVGLLIDKGADVNAKDSWNWTPLHGACENGNEEMVELLIVKGADVNARDGSGRTPLWYAQKKDYSDIAEVLRKHGARE